LYGIQGAEAYGILVCCFLLWNLKSISMADVHSKEQRSYNMSRIKGKDTKPELLVRKFLFSKGFRYRIHVKDLPDLEVKKNTCKRIFL
jgi:DNA mismatch endonuclease Vsr